MKTLLLSGAVLLALATPASAAEVHRLDGVSLQVRDAPRATGICVDLPRSGTCDQAPRRPYEALVVAQRRAVGGAVPASVARVEVVNERGAPVAAATVAGERYRGRHAGTLRFFLAKVTGEPVLVRLFDAAGTLIGAASPGEAATIGRPRRLLTQGRGRESVTVTALTLRALAATPLAVDRTEVVACLRIQRLRGGGSVACRMTEAPLALRTAHGCGGSRSIVAGFVGAEVKAVRLLLGSGRRQTLSPRTLPTGERYVAGLIPRGEAVRRAVAVGTDAAQELALPPTGVRCQDGIRLVDFFPTGLTDAPLAPPAPGDQLAGEADGHRLVVRDGEDDRLCAGADGLRADGSDCALPRVDPRLLPLFAHDGVVTAVLPAEVARVRLPGGREVATLPGDGYTGRYAGRVRFLLASMPAGRFGNVRFLAANGETIATSYLFGDLGEPGRGPVRLAAGRGWRYSAARYGTFGCVGVEPLQGLDCPEPRRAFGAFADVKCEPRVAVVHGTLGPRVRSVVAVLRGGRTIRARIVRVPRRIGTGRAFVVALPPRAELRALRVNGRPRPFRVPAAAEQCGYSLAR